MSNPCRCEGLCYLGTYLYNTSFYRYRWDKTDYDGWFRFQSSFSVASQMVLYVRRVNGKCNLFHRYLPFQCYLLLECDSIVWHVTERGIRLVFYYYQYSRFNLEWNFRNLYPNVKATQWKLTLVVVNHLKEMCLMSKHGFVINLIVITHLSLRYEIFINTIYAATFKQWKRTAPCHTGKCFCLVDVIYVLLSNGNTVSHNYNHIVKPHRITGLCLGCLYRLPKCMWQQHITFIPVVI